MSDAKPITVELPRLKQLPPEQLVNIIEQQQAVMCNNKP